MRLNLLASRLAAAHRAGPEAYPLLRAFFMGLARDLAAMAALLTVDAVAGWILRALG